MEEKTLRVKQEDLNRLLRLAGDVVTYHMEVELIHKHARDLLSQGADVPPEIARALKEVVPTGKKTTDELIKSLMTVRMVPIGDLLGRFHGMIREISRNQAKKVLFAVEGDDTLVDKTIAEKLADPLMHMLRNAVDHGIEPFDERAETGKNEEGKILLKVWADEDNVHFSIEDDGRGLDYDKIRQKAVDMGLFDRAAVDGMTDAEVGPLIFNAGLSTSSEITDISGRGVGMDVVKRNMEELNAELHLASRKGLGTQLSITIPKFRLVDIIDAIVVDAGGEYFAVPMKDIHRIINTTDAAIHYLQKRPFIETPEGALPLYRMAEIVEDIPNDWTDFRSEKLIVLVISDKASRMGLILDNVLGVQRVVVKKAAGCYEYLDEVTGVAGIGQGRMAHVLHTAHLLEKHNILDGGGDVSDLDETDEATETAREVVAAAGDVVERKRLEDVVDAADMDVFDEILSDVDEHLMEINQNIRRLESGVDRELCGTLFRAVHSIKGAFGALKMNSLVRLTNEGEDLLHLLREEKIGVDDTLLDLLYRVTSVIDSSVLELKEGFYPQEAPEDLQEQLEEYKDQVAPKVETSVVFGENIDVDKDTSFGLSFIEILSVQKALSREIPVYEIFIRVNPDVIMKSIRTVVLMTQLFHQGEIIASVPSVPTLERTEEYTAFKLLYQTDLDPEELRAQIQADELTETVDIEPMKKETFM